MQRVYPQHHQRRIHISQQRHCDSYDSVHAAADWLPAHPYHLCSCVVWQCFEQLPADMHSADQQRWHSCPAPGSECCGELRWHFLSHQLILRNTDRLATMSYSSMSDAVFYNSNISLLACQLFVMLVSLSVAIYSVSTARRPKTTAATLAASKT